MHMVNTAKLLDLGWLLRCVENGLQKWHEAALLLSWTNDSANTIYQNMYIMRPLDTRKDQWHVAWCGTMPG